MPSLARFTRPLALGAALAISFVAAGCKNASLPGCRIALNVQLPPSPLTQAEDARLQRVGSGFVLAALDGDNLRWAPLDAQGTLGSESTLSLPKRAPQATPWFGMTSKASPADQIVAVYLAAKEGVANQLEARAISQGAGSPASPSVPLFDVPVGVAAEAVQVAVGSSRTGRRLAIAWAITGKDESPSLLLLGADASPIAAQKAAFRTALAGRTCLAILPSRTDFAVGVLEPPQISGGRAAWHGVEFMDDGSTVYDVTFELEAVPNDCPALAPTPRGYVAVYKNGDGIFFTDFDIAKRIPHGDIIVGALDFGGADRIPRTACVSPMGSEFGLLFERDSGPEVWRVNAFGNPQGSSLFLPSAAGSVGPLSAWPGLDELFVTYVDHAATGTGGVTDGSYTGNLRSFTRVDCPMAVPYFSYDTDGSAEAAPIGDAR